MSEKFQNVPLEDDTKMLRRVVATLDGFNILHEKWVWDGVKGETVVFVSREVAHLPDQELEEKVRCSPFVEVGSQITINRSSSGYTFVSFNFKV